MNLDITSIIAIIVTIVVILQLRNVLGKRTGNERPPYDPFTSKDKKNKDEDEGLDDNVVPMPGRRAPVKPVLNPQLEEDHSTTAVIDRLAKTGSALNEGLHKVVKADPSFNPEQFLEGAKSAYEYIVSAYAAGDRKTLKELLSSDVYEGFEGAIKDRESRKETIDFSFVGINNAKITDTSLVNRDARIKVEFKSELIQAVMDSEGRIVDGDPNAVDEVIDLWTFERGTGSPNPNWVLVATETPEN